MDKRVKKDFRFFIAKMPDTRSADFYLGCLDGCVYIDFCQSKEGLISLCRISFDGYGCCDLSDNANSLNSEMSKMFIDEMKNDELDQKKLTTLIKESINVNQDYIWPDALEEYNLIN